MKLLRFFFNNILLVLFFCVVIYSYYYWDDLIGEETPVGKAVAYLSTEFKSFDSFVDGIKRKQSGEKPVVAESVISNQVAANVSEEKIPESEYIPREMYRNKPAEVFVTPKIEQELDQAVNQLVSKQPQALPLNKMQPETTRGDVEVDFPMVDANTQLWLDARKAFYKRNYELSISNYEQLIASSPDNFDAHGELGNVYFNQGKNVEAAASYYEAAAIMVKAGQPERADSLVPLLNYLDSKKASQLQELLKSDHS